jgi:hypothetical protein
VEIAGTIAVVDAVLALALLVALVGGTYLFLRRYARPAVYDHDERAEYCPCERCFAGYLDENGP